MFVSFDSRSSGKSVQVHLPGCSPPSIREITLPTSSDSQPAACLSASRSCSSSYTLAKTPGFWMDLGTPQNFSLVHSWLARPSRNRNLGEGRQECLQLRCLPRNGCRPFGCSQIHMHQYTSAYALMCAPGVYTHAHLPTYHR